MPVASFHDSSGIGVRQFSPDGTMVGKAADLPPPPTMFASSFPSYVPDRLLLYCEERMVMVNLCHATPALLSINYLR